MNIEYINLIWNIQEINLIIFFDEWWSWSKAIICTWIYNDISPMYIEIET